MDELNHDFQALALEGRAMGEVRLVLFKGPSCSTEHPCSFLDLLKL